MTSEETSEETGEETGELAFEHVGTMVCDDRLLLCDVEYLPPRFAGMARGAIGLDVEVEIEPGTWQLLLARRADGEISVVLLAHDRELDQGTPLEQAEVVARLRVDSGRITALDPTLRDDLDMQTAVLEAPREQVPCMLTPLTAEGEADTAAEPRGALIDIDAGGVFELHASVEQPRRTLFLVIPTD